ncbi:uncharacterized protein LOC131659363 [Vicia villosa]|uniref:uncharacterized protein LOC131659363 n=1 Tax=Vicia villosa TaxID=3911 RepID=UPI00273B0328|nr:uncharacterized protein LOC131659363 [Vicia villosa]
MEGDIAVGNQFKTKAECVRAISKYHMKQCIDFKVNFSDKKRYEICCRNATCKFRLLASFRKRSDLWEIGIMNSLHSCSTSMFNQDHRQLSSQIMCQHLMPLVDKDPSTKVSVCISEIVSEFKFTPSYKKTWIARNKAIEQVYGNWENSYNELPHYLLALKKFVPGTVVEMQTLPVYTDDGTVVNGKQIFHRLFWAFQPSIKGFAYCKPILQVDGTWLYGKYKGTLLMAVAQDGNSNIFPVAFTLVEGETADGWGFFLKNLRMHVAPHPGLCLISDRHASIESAYNNPENGWHEPPSVHVYWYALNQPTFHYYRNEIGMANGDALRWLDNIPLEKWTRAFDGGRRWGHMTTNLVESMNSVFKGTRNLPIMALVRATYYRMGTLFAERGAKWSAVLSSGQTFTESCMKVRKEETAKSSTHHVRIFDYNHNTFSVKETMDHGEGKPMGDYKVNLRDLWCDCGKYQAYRVPCSHVIAACSMVRQDAYALLSDDYRVSNLFGVYSTSFPVLPLDEYWPSFEGDQICHNPLMRRNKKGRPVSSRIRTEMDKYDKLERKCALCRLPGHNRTNCPNVGTKMKNQFVHGLSETIVGVLGGGQLGSMLCQAATKIAIKIVVLDPQENCPASSLCYQHMVESFDDCATVEEFAKRCGVLTFEIEHVNVTTLKKLEKLLIISLTMQDKYLQKVHFSKHGISEKTESIVYRDLKPKNLLLQKDGHVVLTDFNLSFITSCKPHVLVL